MFSVCHSTAYLANSPFILRISPSVLASARMNSSSAPRTSGPGNKPKTTSSYFYDSPAIDEAARQPSVRLTPSTILYTGRFDDGKHLVRSARYLHRELPVRIAHRIDGFRKLPFIVGCNPHIADVHDMYIRAFAILHEFPSIQDVDCSVRYAQILRELLDDHMDVVTLLAKGFRECQRVLDDENMVRQFLDRTLTSRLGLRMLAMHHLALHNESPDHVGIVNKDMKLKNVVSKWSDFVSTLCQDRYGMTPPFRLSGHVNASFPYIQHPLDYILPEILKNAARATVESHKNSDKELPTVYVTIAVNDYDFVIRVSDRGGGIPRHLVPKVMDYNFSTADRIAHTDDYGIAVAQSSYSRGPMHGYGFGLPTSRAYAEYLGGRLDIQSMGGTGTDVYLTLPHIDGKAPNPFRI